MTGVAKQEKGRGDTVQGIQDWKTATDTVKLKCVEAGEEI